MATIATERIRIHTEGPYTPFPPEPNTEFQPGDLCTINAAGQVVKLAAGGASAVDLCVAVDKFPDTYYEPVGENKPLVDVCVLGSGFLVELNVDGDIAQANFQESFDIIVTGGIAKVNLASQVAPAFVPIRLADELYGGVIGDTDARVVGYFLDSVSVGE